MYHCCVCRIVALVLFVGSLTTIFSAEIVAVDRQPINIQLPVGKERLVSFPMPVRLGINSGLLKDGRLRVQNNYKTLYFFANKAFSVQRAQVNLPNGLVILLDIRASSQARSDPLEVLIPDGIVARDGLSGDLQSSRSHHFSSNNGKNSGQYAASLVTAVRSAIQQLYAPLSVLNAQQQKKQHFRMIDFSDEVSAPLVRSPLGSSHLIPLLMDDSLLAMPLASWKSSEMFVTAVQLRNNTPRSLIIDPEQFCGHWQAAAFYPRQNLSASAVDNRALSTNTTTVFLVSHQSFAKALRQCAVNPPNFE